MGGRAFGGRRLASPQCLLERSAPWARRMTSGRVPSSALSRASASLCCALSPATRAWYLGQSPQRALVNKLVAPSKENLSSVEEVSYPPAREGPSRGEITGSTTLVSPSPPGWSTRLITRYTATNLNKAMPYASGRSRDLGHSPHERYLS